MAKFKWQYFLKDNQLTKDDQNDCIAEVNIRDTMRNEDIAQQIIDEGSEILWCMFLHNATGSFLTV